MIEKWGNMLHMISIHISNISLLKGIDCFHFISKMELYFIYLSLELAPELG